MRTKLLLFAAIPFVALLTACGDNTQSSRDGDLDVSRGSLRLGGLMWDRWWRVTGDAEPTDTFPLYASTEGTRSGADTWRCAECHGFDYRGAAGRYGQGTHFTGVPGVLDRVGTRTRQELFDIIATGTPPGSGGSAVTPEHAFGGVLSDLEIFSLVRFLIDGLVDTTLVVDPPTGISNGDAERGATLFESDVTGPCALCHGGFGKAIPVAEEDGEPGSVGTASRRDPERALHRIRWGIPGSPMPDAVGAALPLADHNDLLAFGQTLPPPDP